MTHRCGYGTYCPACLPDSEPEPNRECVWCGAPCEPGDLYCSPRCERADLDGAGLAKCACGRVIVAGASACSYCRAKEHLAKLAAAAPAMAAIDAPTEATALDEIRAEKGSVI